MTNTIMHTAISDSQDSIVKIRETYQQLCEDSVTYGATVNGKTVILVDESYESFIHSLIRLEEFIADVLTTNELGYWMGDNAFGRYTLIELPLSKYFSKVSSYSQIDSTGYILSEHVQLFFNCWSTLLLWEECFDNPKGYSSKPNRAQYQRFNDLLELIRQQSRTPEFKLSVRRRKERSVENQKSGNDYINALFKNSKSKLLVLRVDFSYLKEYSKDISADHARSDLKRFLNNRRSNKKIFEHWVGCIWKLEWGPEKGCHFHLIIFLNGQKCQQDITRAKMFGEYWRKLTKNKGIYWNCNAGHYQYRGIGMIERREIAKRHILSARVLNYLTKSDQYLRAERIEGGDCFGRSVAPTEQNNKPGKPRQSETIDVYG